MFPSAVAVTLALTCKSPDGGATKHNHTLSARVVLGVRLCLQGGACIYPHPTPPTILANVRILLLPLCSVFVVQTCFEHGVSYMGWWASRIRYNVYYMIGASFGAEESGAVYG